MDTVPVCQYCKSVTAYFWTKVKDEVICEKCCGKSESFEGEKFDPIVPSFEAEDSEQYNRFQTTFSVDEEGRIHEIEPPTEETTDNNANSCKLKEIGKLNKFKRKSKFVNLKYGKNRNKATLITKSKGNRRNLFKKNVLKAPVATATPTTTDFVVFKGVYYQVGDIVSMIDIDGGTYYAQIRGFLTDQYNNKSAAITWLLPTQASPDPEKEFDPATYVIGPEEDIPRKLEFMEFICHAPSDYYKKKRSLFNLGDVLNETSCIYSRLSPAFKVVG